MGSKPLRVMHVVLGLDVGGLEKQVLELVRHLDRSVVLPEIVCTDFVGPLADLYPMEPPIAAVAARPGFDVRAAARLARRFRDSRSDIIHSHNERAHYLSVFSGRMMGVPVHINTRHGVHFPTTWRGALRRRITARLSDVIVAVSTEVRDAALRIDGIPAAKLRIIHNGTDVTATRLTRGEARRQLGLNETDFVLGAVGRLAAEKDYLTFVDAFAALRSEMPQIAGVILGDGPLLPELSAAARAAGLDRLHFHGYRPDAVALLPAFDVFVQPSLTEGIALSVIEAMAAGLPVVATSVGGNTEALGDGEAGILVPPRDAGALTRAILSLASDNERRATLAAAGRRRAAEHFSIDAIARSYEALYLELARLKGLKV